MPLGMQQCIINMISRLLLLQHGLCRAAFLWLLAAVEARFPRSLCEPGTRICVCITFCFRLQ